MENRKVTCDFCGRDLTITSNSCGWKISVKNSSIPCESGAVTDMYMTPHLEHNLDFCHIGCFKNWFNKKFTKDES